MKHLWKHSTCARCGTIRTSAPKRETTEPGKTPSRFDYRLRDGLGTLDRRPSCASAKPAGSRTARRNGRHAKVMAASRAGGRRLVTKEEVVRRERTEYAAASHYAPPLPPGDAGPTLAPPEPPAAS